MIYQVAPYDLPGGTLWSTLVENPIFIVFWGKQGLTLWSTMKNQVAPYDLP